MLSTKVIVMIGTLSITIGAMANPLDGIRKDKPVCFGHSYSAAEIKSRPKQTVRDLRLRFHVDEYTTAQTPMLNVAARLKKANGKIGKYTNDMICDTETDASGVSGIHCAVECDGGGAEIHWQAATAESGLIFVNDGFVLYGGCDDEDQSKTVFLTPTAGGDDVFDLEQVACE